MEFAPTFPASDHGRLQPDNERATPEGLRGTEVLRKPRLVAILPDTQSDVEYRTPSTGRKEPLPRGLVYGPTIETKVRDGSYMAKSKHDQTAERLAKKEGTEYNRGQGADIQGGRRVIEVETEATVRDGLLQLRGYQKPVYIAGADEKATQAALEATKGTTVGVMDDKGNVVRSSSRKKRSERKGPEA